MSDRDTYTEVSSESWFDRVRESIKGVAAGLFLLVVAFPLLYWNEGRAVKTARGLQEGASAVVSVKPDAVDPANDHRLIHTTGLASSGETLRDELFGVEAAGLKLVREVQMYQWKETKRTQRRKEGSREVKTTTYEYEKVWAPELQPSKSFKRALGHENPEEMPYESKTFVASKVTVGAFELPPSLVDKIGGAKELAVTQQMALRMRPSLAARARLTDDGYYIGLRPSLPEVGDLHVRYKIVGASTVSFVAQQSGTTLRPFPTSTGGTIELLQTGTLDAATMFKTAQAQNATLTWILRGIGLALIFFGLLLVFNPLAAFADLLPFLGDLLRFGLAAFAGAAMLVLGGLTIAIAWVGHRPLVGIPLLAGSVALLVALKLLGRSRKSQPAPEQRPALSNT